MNNWMPPFHSGTRAGGKDLQDLRGLARSPFHAFLRKVARPPGPRVKTATPEAPAPAYRMIAAFASSQTWRWLAEYVRHRFGPRHPFQTYQGHGSGIYRLQGDEDGDEVRVALAGDWGTGTDEAALVARQIEGFRAHYTIHLGDVYYMGDGREVAENFLGQPVQGSHFTPIAWPLGSRGSFSLLGNHEMYARGIAYFKHILPSLGEMRNGVSQGQQASFFCLENDDWRVIGIDTGYDSVNWPFIESILEPDCALPPLLIDWLEKALKPSEDDARGIIVLSHHQYFSAFDHAYPKAATQLATFFKRPVLWFWGHEHRLTIYDKFSVKDGVEAFGRCIGHAGMPVDLAPTTPAHPEVPIVFLDERVYHNDEHLHLGMNGFARLTFRSKQLLVDYVDLHGTCIYTETWTAEDAQLLREDAGPV
jgi:hypothetical protein